MARYSGLAALWPRRPGGPRGTDDPYYKLYGWLLPDEIAGPWDISAEVFRCPYVTIVPLWELRERGRRAGIGWRRLYSWLDQSQEAGCPPFLVLFKAPWPGPDPDGRVRRRTVVAFMPLYYWGLFRDPTWIVRRRVEEWKASFHARHHDVTFLQECRGSPAPFPGPAAMRGPRTP